MEMISTTQSRVKEVGVKREKICEAGVLRGIWESAISQNRAQRDDLTDAFIKGRMTGGAAHGSFPTTLSVCLAGEY